MLDGRPRRCASATVVTGNHQVIALALGHTCGNGAHANFRHQLDADVAVRRHVFQVVNELGQIFNGINVVVWGRRNQTHAWHRVTQLTDVVGHFAAWQLTTFTRLGTLGHLDLNLISTVQVLSGDTEAARGHLLDLGAEGIASLEGHVDFHFFGANDALQSLALFNRDAFEFVAITCGVFTTFTGVALAANAVHGNGQCGVCFC